MIPKTRSRDSTTHRTLSRPFAAALETENMSAFVTNVLHIEPHVWQKTKQNLNNNVVRVLCAKNTRLKSQDDDGNFVNQNFGNNQNNGGGGGNNGNNRGNQSGGGGRGNRPWNNNNNQQQQQHNDGGGGGGGGGFQNKRRRF